MLAIDTNTLAVLNASNPKERVKVEVQQVSDGGEATQFVELKLTHEQIDGCVRTVLRKIVLDRKK